VANHLTHGLVAVTRTDCLPGYTPRYPRGHEVRPEVKEWAQVNGRNDLPWPEKLEHGVWYVQNRSLGLNIRILVRALMVPFRQRGISRSDHACDRTPMRRGMTQWRSPDLREKVRPQ